MKIKRSPPWRAAVVFILVFSVICTLLLGYLAYKRKSGFSEDTVRQLISPHARWRDWTDNPCKYQIYGDPAIAGTQYIKTKFSCTNGETSMQTLALTAFPDHSVNGVLAETARINGWDKNIVLDKDKGWKCFYGGREIVRYEEPVIETATIECVENGGKLK